MPGSAVKKDKGLTLPQMRAFLAYKQEGSVAAAARSLGFTDSAIRQQLDALPEGFLVNAAMVEKVRKILEGIDALNPNLKDVGAALDNLPRYSVVIDNDTEETWIAIGRKWPEDTWLWCGVGATEGILTSEEITKRYPHESPILLAKGLEDVRRV